MKRRSLIHAFVALSAVAFLAGSASAQTPSSAPPLVVNPDKAPALDRDHVRTGPVYYAPNGWYSPYPGIFAPVPYPNWNYPPHWIYSYMNWDDHSRTRRRDDVDGRTYKGRDTLAPAVPYSDYLKDQKDLIKPEPKVAKPAPTADKALLEIRLPAADAKLYFDGKEATAGEGETRLFHTPSLKPGESYTFNIKTTWPGGLFDDLTNEVVVSFRAGEHKIVDLRPKDKDKN